MSKHDVDLLVKDLGDHLIRALDMGGEPEREATVKDTLRGWFTRSGRGARAVEARKDAAQRLFDRAERYRTQCERSVHDAFGRLGVANARLEMQEIEHQRRTAGLQRKTFKQSLEIRRLTDLLKDRELDRAAAELGLPPLAEAAQEGK